MGYISINVKNLGLELSQDIELRIYGACFFVEAKAGGHIYLNDDFAGYVGIGGKALNIESFILLNNCSEAWKPDVEELIASSKKLRENSKWIMCMNSGCIHYFEDMCMKNMADEKIILDCEGKCETFEAGVNEGYLQEGGE